MDTFATTVLAGLVISLLSGAVGYFARKVKHPEKYLPTLSKNQKKTAYDFIRDCKHEYHYTKDARYGNEPRLVHGKINLQMKDRGIIEGDMRYDLQDRRSLSYQVRGEVSNGRMSYTSVCEDDPSDVYATLFTAILDPKIVGQMVGVDYQKVPYASPVVLSDDELTAERVAELVHASNLALYGFDKTT